jgi:hypothetical protein
MSNVESESGEVTCSYCKQTHTWVAIQADDEPANIQGMLYFLLRETGEDLSDWKITEAYYFECSCGRGFVVAEVPEACEPDDGGYSAPAYLVIGLHGKLESGERLLPLRIEKKTKSEISLVRDSVKLAK